MQSSEAGAAEKVLGQFGSQGGVGSPCPALPLSYPVSKAPSSVYKKTPQGRGGRGHVHHLLIPTQSWWGVKEPPLGNAHCSLGPLRAVWLFPPGGSGRLELPWTPTLFSICDWLNRVPSNSCTADLSPRRQSVTVFGGGGL